MLSLIDEAHAKIKMMVMTRTKMMMMLMVGGPHAGSLAKHLIVVMQQMRFTESPCPNIPTMVATIHQRQEEL